MELLNRSVVIAKPLRPYLEWAKEDDAEGLEQSWPNLFDAMLEGWVTDEAFWPKDRTLRMFREWFEIQMSSVVQDLDRDTPLELI